MTQVSVSGFDDIAERLDAILASSDAKLVATAPEIADELLAIGEMILESWLSAHGKAPTARTVEGFRLLALHRQGARGDASFNACRETCRELVITATLFASMPSMPRRHGGFASARWSQPIWRCSSAVNSTSQASANSAAPRARFAQHETNTQPEMA